MYFEVRDMRTPNGLGRIVGAGGEEDESSYLQSFRSKQLEECSCYQLGWRRLQKEQVGRGRSGVLP